MIFRASDRPAEYARPVAQTIGTTAAAAWSNAVRHEAFPAGRGGVAPVRGWLAAVRRPLPEGLFLVLLQVVHFQIAGGFGASSRIQAIVVHFVPPVVERVPEEMRVKGVRF
jgi:hypothetical protein